MSVTSIGTYRPVWQHGQERIAGPDEDVLTMAVAAAAAATTGAPAEVSRIVLVTAAPDILDGFGAGVLLRSLGLEDSVPVELRIGAAPATIEALLEATEGTLVVAVDAGPSAACSAAVTIASGPGIELTPAGRHTGSLPMRVRHVGSAAADVYQDARVERELASVPLLQRLAGDGRPYVVGLPPKDARRLGAAESAVTATGAAAPLLLLADLAQAQETSGCRLVGLDAAAGVGADVRVGGEVTVRRDERPAVPSERRPVDSSPGTVIPFAMPAYARAFEAKIGMVAARCACGEISFPPRLVCLACDRYAETTPVGLARTGEVYTAVTVHVPIPGIAGKYTLAIVALDDSPVRVLAPVTDRAAGEVPIGTRGHLVLRRIAEREGVPDYGYALQLDVTEDIA